MVMWNYIHQHHRTHLREATHPLSLSRVCSYALNFPWEESAGIQQQPQQQQPNQTCSVLRKRTAKSVVVDEEKFLDLSVFRTFYLPTETGSSKAD